MSSNYARTKRALSRVLTLVHQRAREALLGNVAHDIADLRLRRIARAVESLPDTQHEIFRLARLEGLDQAAIARRLGMTEQEASEHLVLAIEMILRSLDRQSRRGPNSATEKYG